MEQDVVQLEGQVEEVFHAAYFLADLHIQLLFVAALLRPVEHEQVVQLLVLLGTEGLSDGIFVLLPLRNDLVLAFLPLFDFFALQRLCFGKFDSRSVQYILVLPHHAVKHRVVQRGHL